MGTWRVVLLVAVTWTVGAGGFLQAGQSSESAAPAANIKPAISLTLRAVKDVVKAGSPIFVKVITTNVSDHNVTVVYHYMEVPVGFGFDVHYETGESAPDGIFRRKLKAQNDPAATGVKPMTGTAAYVELASGKTFEHQIDVGYQYDMTRPGKYTIQVARIDTESKTAVKSNTITVTVTP